ncbi:MAG: DUF188 domain-containing protein [Treponema sp.]|jgi:uncharacterized protein YaiI (UPF0178 family)|nr:DUF188 domain-containing protein [Treponema sp.]
MKILVDADSCPKAARELVLRRAAKLNLRIIFAANRQIPCSLTNNSLASNSLASNADEEITGAEMEICPEGENSADDRIVELACGGDIVITRDVPLAKRLVEKDISVLDDRGRFFTSNNINELLSIRNFTVGLAENGLGAERTSNYGKKELKSFADSLDRTLSKKSLAQTPR